MNAINNLMLAARIIDAFNAENILIDNTCSIVPLDKKQIKKDITEINKRSCKLLFSIGKISEAKRIAQIEFIERLLNEKE